MFVILSYDVNRKRVGKALRICRKYLAHIQKSVFEGRLTEGQAIDSDEDSVCIYCMESVRYAKKEQIGLIERTSNII